ncbi:spinster family MFS transporter [Rhodohalobacter mucosus]|uniref:MFS transporter n=1 Tax=Rhodohalobacter mucosus TaxID=2079485 RepID=A0A316TKS1_9BACT|nr:MFS transporter [Rhodohalobacter mucosus]PWN05137.1 MFS transporter [Rhodohalobacter mucosus]
MIRKTALGTVFLLTIVYILSFVDRQIIAVLGTQIRDSLNLTNFQIGLLYGPVFSVIYAFAGIPMGRIADKTSRIVMICIGLAIWSLMTVLSGFAASFTFLVTARLLVGISQAMLSPAVYSYLADRFSEKDRATVFSVYASGIFIGIGLSFLAGGTISLNYDWQTAMIAAGVPGLILAPIVWFLIKEPERTKEYAPEMGSTVQEIQNILSNRSIRWHLAGFSFLACTGYTILGFAGNIFNDVYSRPDLTAQFGWFMFGVGAMVMISGKTADYLARKNAARRYWMGVVAALAGLPFYLFGLFAEDAGMAFFLIGTGVLFSSSYNGVAAALIQYYVNPGQRALTGGIYLFVISIAGFGLGPPVTGWLTDAVFSGRYAVSSAILTVMLICSAGAASSFIRAMALYQKDAIVRT